MYSRNLTRNFEVFIAGSSASGSYSTITPTYSYDNSEKVFALDLGGSFDLTPEKDNNRLLFGIGGSWVQVQYDYGEFVYSDRAEMNQIRNSISMFLIKLEERYSFSSGFFVAAYVTTRTCFGERKVVDRSITPSGTIGVSGGVRYFVNFGIGAGYLF
jgi:hypothetical protein